MSTSSVFAFQDPVDFLNFQLKENKGKNPQFSIRNWARRVGYKNPSLLFQVLKRERTLRLELATKLALDLRLKAKEKRYFELLVLKNLSRAEADRAELQKNIENLRPPKFRQTRPLSLAVFAAAADWYHWAILVLVTHPKFEENETFLFKNLGGKVHRRDIRGAIDRLLELGLLKRDPTGRLVRDNSDQSIFMRNEIPSEAIRMYHAQMADLAKESIEGQSVDERYLRGTTFLLAPENVEKAREILRRAHEEIMSLGDAAAEPSEVVHLQSFMFKISSINGETCAAPSSRHKRHTRTGVRSNGTH